MADHRVRLDDDELALVVAALRARAAGLSPNGRRLVLRLAARLELNSGGNPDWVLEGGQVRREPPAS